MKFVDVVVLLDALVLIVMGILGFAEGHSVASLVAGVLFGGLLLGFLAYTKTNPRVGRIGAAVVCLLPLGRFLPALLKKHNIYPAGIIVACSIITFCVLGAGHMMAMSKRKKMV